MRPGGQTRRRALPWALGIVSLLILGVVALSIAAVIFIPRWTRQTSNTNDGRQTASNSNLNAGTSGGVDQPNSNVSHANVNAIVGLPNSNSNDNGNANTNANSNAGSEAGAPSDKDQVLVQLTDLEHEWTVANLNADKKALARILADDYVGSSPTGMQGKADYIKNIQRDTSVERWDFEDLNVTLHGDRATLSGKVKLVIKGEERVFNFVDKFVWRDGRWQATGSEVNLVQ